MESLNPLFLSTIQGFDEQTGNPVEFAPVHRRHHETMNETRGGEPKVMSTDEDSTAREVGRQTGMYAGNSQVNRQYGESAD